MTDPLHLKYLSDKIDSLDDKLDVFAERINVFAERIKSLEERLWKHKMCDPSAVFNGEIR